MPVKEEVLELLSEGSPKRYSEITSALHRPDKTIFIVLKDLEGDGLVVQEKEKGPWTLTDAGRTEYELAMSTVTTREVREFGRTASSQVVIHSMTRIETLLENTYNRFTPMHPMFVRLVYHVEPDAPWEYEDICTMVTDLTMLFVKLVKDNRRSTLDKLRGRRQLEFPDAKVHARMMQEIKDAGFEDYKGDFKEYLRWSSSKLKDESRVLSRLKADAPEFRAFISYLTLKIDELSRDVAALDGS